MAIILVGGSILASEIFPQIQSELKQELGAFEAYGMIFGIMAIGMLFFVVSILELVISLGLSRLKKWAAYLAIGLSCLGIVFALSTWNASSREWSIAALLYNGLMIVLIGSSWPRFGPAKRESLPAAE
ncbi:MAG: hypothetical protein HYX91_00475 [Chloroflexi bacterium]|nr:hypothetical protein [Chloroflexota bacterium]